MAFRKYLVALSCVATLGSAAVVAHAQEKWPTRPITYVVPFAAGGTTDILGRMISNKLGPALGTTFVVENKAGAGGNIGSDQVAKAKPDGYTLLGGTISSHAINVSLYPKLPYDPIKSFEPITLIGTLPNVLVVNANSPHRTMADVLAAAKSRPEAVTFGSSGSGTSQHLAGELFQSMTGAKLLHVPYKGSAPAMQALLGGEVTMVFENIVSAVPLIEAGKIRALAVTSTQRAASLPQVPTVAEAGLPGYEIVSWQAIFAPAGTPQPVTQRLATEIRKILQEPDVRSQLSALGIEPSGAGPAELAAFQKTEVQKWGQLIRTANITLQ